MRMILLRIADQIGHHGENAWPGINTIARDCNISTRQVQKCIGGLVELGELLVFNNAGGSKDCPADRRPNRYEMPLMDGWAPPRSIHPKSDPFAYMKAVFALDPAEPDGVNSTTPREVSPTTPRNDNGVNSRVERGELQGSNGVSPTTPDIPLIHPDKEQSHRVREGNQVFDQTTAAAVVDFSDFKPSETTLERIRLRYPDIRDDYIRDELPGFLVFAESTRWPRRRLQSKFFDQVVRHWQMQLKNPGGNTNGTRISSPADEYAARIERERKHLSKLDDGAMGQDGEAVSSAMVPQ